MLTIKVIFAILLGLAVCFICFLNGYGVGMIDGYEKAKKENKEDKK